MLADAFRVGANVLKTSVDSVKKTLVAQIGSVVENYVFSDNAEIWQTWGFSSRPSPPIGGVSAAEAMTINLGDRDRIFAGRDIRGQGIYGNLQDGETCVYATGSDGNGQARLLLKADSSISLYTRTGPSATGMIVNINPGTDTISLTNAAGNGIIIQPSGIVLTAGGGQAGLKLNSDGSLSLVGSGNAQVNGASIVLGNIVSPGINSALTGPVGTAGKASLKTLIE